MPGRYGGLTWLSEQAVRLRRNDWSGNCQGATEEMWTILIRLRDLDSGTGSVTSTTGDLTVDDVRELIANGDLTFPQQPPPPTNEQPPGEDPTFTATVNASTRWDRSALPGKILSHDDGDDYNVEIYPYGFLTPKNPDGTDQPGATTTETVSCQQLQIIDGEIIPVETWVIVLRIIQYRVATTVVTVTGTGQFVGQSTSIEELQRAHYMQVPIWL